MKAILITAVFLGALYFISPVSDWFSGGITCEVDNYLDSWPQEPEETCA
jgi:hypothetical protein